MNDVSSSVGWEARVLAEQHGNLANKPTPKKGPLASNSCTPLLTSLFAFGRLHCPAEAMLLNLFYN